MILAALNWIDGVRYRLKFGRWCSHPKWTEWYLVDLGRAKVRHCLTCNRTEHT